MFHFRMIGMLEARKALVWSEESSNLVINSLIHQLVLMKDFDLDFKLLIEPARFSSQ